ncbi:MAG: aldehyde dehydrogenase (NADP(+)), partial [Acidobacteriota bacterium]|nr:aldehyde dehydrogenase (NADP(+)) [Acidobacteriota bacterium]
MLHGYSMINGASRQGNGAVFAGIDPATGTTLDPAYHYAALEDLNLAADLAEEAFATYAKLPGKEKAGFL